VSNVLEIIPLGGIGEFGMNCTLMRCGDEMLILDAGMGFPEESTYASTSAFLTSTSLNSIATTSWPSCSRMATKIISAPFRTF
jgi:mRNA degradation ribonuclease J1/J2